jgi:hypothetical protein
MTQSTTPHWPQIRHVGVGALGFGPNISAAATAMNDALLAHGYKQSDMPLYSAFQTEAGLTADGFPGAATMAALGDEMQRQGGLLAPVQIYPWLGPPNGYDGVNAPLPSEWQPAAAPTTTKPATTTTTTTTTSTPSTMSPWIIGGAAAVVAGGVGYAVYRARKRRRG